MKSRINYKSKKTIAIIALIVVLAIFAAAGSFLFIKGNIDVRASKLESNDKNDDTQNTEQITENNNSEVDSNTSKNEGTPNISENNVVLNTNSESTQNYTTTTTVEEEVEVEKTLTGFNQKRLNVNNSLFANLLSVLPDVTSSIESITPSTLNAVQNGDEITYTITATITNPEQMNTVNISFELPDGTELVEDSISNDGVLNGSIVNWIITAESEVSVQLTVKVTAESGKIEALATVEGIETTEVVNPIIKTELSADVTEVNKDDVITYTLSVENTSDVEANVEVATEVPDKTELEEGNETIWTKTIAANTTETFTYQVKASNYEKDYAIENTAKVNSIDTNIVLVNYVDTIAPEITLNGDKTITLEAGIDEYTEAYATVTDNVDEIITDLAPEYINFTGANGQREYNLHEVDTSRVGQYKVVYKCTDANGNTGVDALRHDHDYVIRIVNVVDTTAPEITLNGDKTITLEVGIDEYTEAYATVTDNVDETITDLTPEYINFTGVNGQREYNLHEVDTSRVGQYKVVYKCTDANGNTGVDALRHDHDNVIRIVNVVDTTKPVVTLNGVDGNKTYFEETVEADKTATYTDLGASVTDNVDADCTIDAATNINYIDATGNAIAVQKVNLAVPGEYRLGYTYTDAAGNKAMARRIVKVVDTTAPEITLNGDKTITLEAGIDEYTEAYATVTDNVDETITNLAPVQINYTSPTNVKQNNLTTIDTTREGTYKVVYKYTDTNGNVGVDVARHDHDYVMRVVTVKDTQDPVATVTTSNNGEATNQYVTVTITTSEPIQELAGWTKVDAKTFKKDYLTNGDYSVEIKDLASHAVTVDFTVEGIDKDLPTVTGVTQVYEDKEGGRIKVTITFNEAVKNVSGINDMRKVSDKEYYSYVYNTKQKTLNFEDLIGNKNSYVLDIEDLF